MYESNSETWGWAAGFKLNSVALVTLSAVTACVSEWSPPEARFSSIFSTQITSPPLYHRPLYYLPSLFTIEMLFNYEALRLQMAPGLEVMSWKANVIRWDTAAHFPSGSVLANVISRWSGVYARIHHIYDYINTMFAHTDFYFKCTPLILPCIYTANKTHLGKTEKIYLYTVYIYF